MSGDAGGVETELTIGKVHQIWRYPVSSFGGELLASARLTPTGLEGDRQGAFYEVGGSVVFPGVVRKWNIAPRMSARMTASGEIEVSAEGQGWGPIENPALSSFCGEPVEFKRYGEDGIAQRYAFEPIHLLSLQAIEALRRQLPDSVIDVRRFRPNILADLSGIEGLVPENRLIGREFTIGGLRLRGIRASGRCSFTTLAQPGLPEDRAVLRALIDGFEKNLGIYCEVLGEGEIAVGDEMRSEPLPEKPIVIVGAGQAGAMVAKALRDLGLRQLIALFGDERHLPYERPPLSKPGAEVTPVLPPEQFEALELDLHLNRRVVALHPAEAEIETEDGVRHPYDRLILATGGSARRLPGIDRGHGRLHVIRSRDDAERLEPALVPGVRIGVIGAGWLGLEIAASARRLGAEVFIFARQDRVLSRSLPAEVGDIVEARHRAEGVMLRLGEMPEVVERSDGVELHLPGGVERVEHLIFAIGMVPNDHLARHAGLRTSDGIVTDARGATSDPRIFAIGDVARQDGLRLESWHGANDQALALARHLLGLPPEAATVPRFWSSQFDMMIQIAGMPDVAARSIRHEDGPAPFWDFGSFAVAINRPREIHQYAGALTQDAAAPVEVIASREYTQRIPLGPAADFPPNVLHKVEVEGIGPVLVANLDGQFRATDDLCPHAAASLAEGFIERGRIVCPIHFAEFDMQTGQPFSAPPGCAHLRCFGVAVEGEQVTLLV